MLQSIFVSNFVFDFKSVCECTGITNKPFLVNSEQNFSRRYVELSDSENCFLFGEKDQINLEYVQMFHCVY
jgi:hypothetical protein